MKPVEKEPQNIDDFIKALSYYTCPTCDDDMVIILASTETTTMPPTEAKRLYIDDEGTERVLVQAFLYCNKCHTRMPAPSVDIQ